MVEVTICGSAAVFEVEGLDKLWAFKSRMEIPLRHILGVRADPTAARTWWKGLRMPGTSVSGVITAGTFYQDGKRIFWDVHDPERTIVIELADERYNELIVQVTDPAATVAQLDDARKSASGTVEPQG